MKRLVAVLVAILAFTLAKPLFAQTTSDPIFSMKRLSVAAGVERENLLTYANEDLAWAAVLPIAYNVLSPPPGGNGIRLSLTARVSQSFDLNQDTQFWLGARVTLWRGAQ